jgi:hypothetical protein
LLSNARPGFPKYALIHCGAPQKPTGPFNAMIVVELSATRPDAVRGWVGGILQSPRFASCPQQAELLKYVVEETVAGRGDLLKQYTIATEALGRAASFDPAVDPIVRITMGRLRKSLDAYYLAEGADDLIRIEVPVGSYRPQAMMFESISSYRMQTGRLVAGPPPRRPFMPYLAAALLLMVSANFISIQYLVAQQQPVALNAKLEQRVVDVGASVAEMGDHQFDAVQLLEDFPVPVRKGRVASAKRKDRHGVASCCDSPSDFADSSSPQQ